MDEPSEVVLNPFLYAAYNQNDLEKQVKKQEDIKNCRDDNGRNALMHAAIGDNSKVVDTLTRRGIQSDDVDSQGATALHWAARCGSLEVAKEILNSEIPSKRAKLILAKDLDGVTPLHVAATIGSSKMLKTAVGLPESIYDGVVDKFGRSPLHYAASRASLDCVRHLLNFDHPYVDQRDKYSMTPLMCAVGVNLPQAVDICELLAKKKSSAANHLNCDGQSALHLAVAAGNVRVVKLLASPPISVQIGSQDQENRTPLHYAAEQGDVDIVKILLDYKASVVSRDKRGAVPAHYAAQVSREALHLVLEKATTKNVKDTEGRTCLMWAVCAGNEDVVSYLLQREVDRKEADNKGYTALHLAAMTNQESMCKMLIRQGWNPSERDQQNNTPMHLAAGRGHAEVVRSLVTEGANMSDKDTMGRTPIFWPFLGGQPHTAHVMIKELGFEWRTVESTKLGKRISPLVDCCGRTPLHAAAFAGYPACITILLGIESADDCLSSPLIGWPDQDGQTALHVACERGTVDCVKQLLRSGAGLNALDKDMQTPLDFADRTTNEEAKNIIIAYLKNNGALTGVAVENLAAGTIQRFMKRSKWRCKARRTLAGKKQAESSQH